MTTDFSAPEFFDVREIPCRVKHAQILQRWTDLPVQGFFVLVNDHDPVPLYYQFQALYGAAFDWEYLERGPEVYQVRITKLAQVTPADLSQVGGCGGHDHR